MTGTAKTRAELTELAGNPFRQTAQPTNQDFQDLVASLYNLLDDDAADDIFNVDRVLIQTIDPETPGVAI